MEINVKKKVELVSPHPLHKNHSKHPFTLTQTNPPLKVEIHTSHKIKSL